MAHVFISYAKEDRSLVESLARALELAGHDAWFDRELAAGSFRDQIERKLEQVDVAVVVWSERSKRSRYVIDESERAVARGVLLPVRIDRAELPLGFGALQTFDLSSWSGRADDPKLGTILLQIEKIAKEPSPPAGRPPIQVVARSLLLACCGAAMLAPVLALLATIRQGRPASAVALGDGAESFVLALVGTVPVMLWSGLEVRRGGLSHWTLIVRRAGGIFVSSALAALALTVAAAAAGVSKDLSPPARLAQLGLVVVVATLLIAALISSGKAFRYALRRASLRD